jgi:hypothetical protein
MAGRYKKGWSKDHQAIFKLYIEGYSPAEIVEKTKLELSKVRAIIGSDKFHQNHDKVITNSLETAKKALQDRLVEAAGRIIMLMRQGKPDERIQFDAAKEILYQCGMKPVEVIETRGRQYTPEEIESSLKVMKEIQGIEEKLSTQGSGFLIKRDAEPSSPVHLITNQDSKTSQGAEEVVDTKVEEVAIV